MARNAHFPVLGRLGYARVSEGTLTIERATGIVTVRRKRSRTRYQLTLDKVAEIIAQKHCEAIAREKRAAKIAKRKAKRGLL